MVSALVVDDNRQPADCICQMLDFLGVSAQAAYGSRAAMLALRDQVPNIIFLDINMPGVDGFEVMAYLRREPRFRNVPIIVVTADDTLQTRIQALRLGATQILIKPATLDAIEEALKVAKVL